MRFISATAMFLLMAACQSGGVKDRAGAETVRHEFKWIGYNPDTRTLNIQFNDGSRSNFEGVAEGVYSDLMRAAGKMAFFTNSIQGRYAATPGE